MDGKGVLKWPNNTSYEGTFSKGLMDGQGKMTFADGKVYLGSF